MTHKNKTKEIIEVQCENIQDSVNSLREWHDTNELPEDDEFEFTLREIEFTIKILHELAVKPA